ncbi:MAG: L,D-transpeptidase family protein [Gammaproteobacteria bacterium]
MHIEISISDQKLWLKDKEKILAEYLVSTAKNGAGEIMNSECTPRGEHEVVELYGADQAANTVFVGRIKTGEIFVPSLREKYPDRDWILTRIIRLAGCEPEKNQGEELDTYNRYIYIHGSPDNVEMGVPGSHGCVRMKNQDVIDLFNQVSIGTKVMIKESL